MAVRIVGQAGRERAARCIRAGLAVERDEIERGRFADVPVLREAVETPLERAAQMFEYADARWPETACGEFGRDGGRRAAVGAQHEQAPARQQVTRERRERTADERYRADVLQRPAEARGRERQRRRRGQHAPFVGGKLARERRADAEQHRVATREHADGRRAAGEHARNVERRRPRFARGRQPCGQHVEMPLRADDERRVEQRAPRAAAEPRVTVVADAHYRQPRRHAPFPIVRFHRVAAQP